MTSSVPIHKWNMFLQIVESFFGGVGLLIRNSDGIIVDMISWLPDTFPEEFAPELQCTTLDRFCLIMILTEHFINQAKFI